MCASGNYPETAVSWPSSKANVSSVGGAYIDERGQIVASDFAVSGRSNIDPNRRCPDCCGLCGLQPIASYIALPIPPKSIYDINISVVGDSYTASDG